MIPYIIFYVDEYDKKNIITDHCDDINILKFVIAEVMFDGANEVFSFSAECIGENELNYYLIDWCEMSKLEVRYSLDLEWKIVNLDDKEILSLCLDRYKYI